MKNTILIMILAAGIFSCGLFSPRPVEPPVGQSVIDPLNFQGILSSTAESFDKLVYEDLFNPLYTYETQDGRIFYRSNALSRYQTIARLYDTVIVSWQRDTTIVEPPVFNRDAVIVLYRNYSVTALKSARQFVFSGAATLELRYFNDKSTWTISKFRDGEINSIFSPTYTDSI